MCIKKQQQHLLAMWYLFTRVLFFPVRWVIIIMFALQLFTVFNLTKNKNIVECIYGYSFVVVLLLFLVKPQKSGTSTCKFMVLQYNSFLNWYYCHWNLPLVYIVRCTSVLNVFEFWFFSAVIVAIQCVYFMKWFFLMENQMCWAAIYEWLNGVFLKKKNTMKNKQQMILFSNNISKQIHDRKIDVHSCMMTE